MVGEPGVEALAPGLHLPWREALRVEDELCLLEIPAKGGDPHQPFIPAEALELRSRVLGLPLSS